MLKICLAFLLRDMPRVAGWWRGWGQGLPRKLLIVLLHLFHIVIIAFIFRAVVFDSGGESLSERRL
jgi:hypothetical protein